MIVVRCPTRECEGKDTLKMTEKYGGIPIMFYCLKHNQCLEVKDVKFVEKGEVDI